MAVPESVVYIGTVCFRHSSKQQEFNARVAAHCMIREEFDVFVMEYLSSKGMIFISSTDLYILRSWFYKFGYDGEVAALARKVGGKRVGEVVFSTPKTKLSMLATSNLELCEDEGAKVFLKTEEIKNISALDDQLGVFPKKTVPSILNDTIFGDMIDVFPECIPQAYAIVDAAKAVNLIGIMHDSGLEYRCLFEGQDAKDFRDFSPYLILLNKHSDFTRNLFTSSSMPNALWNKNIAIYLRSTASIDDLAIGFRRLIRAYEVNGEYHYFRFWDGVFAYIFFEELKTFKEYISYFFNQNGHACVIIAISLDEKKARIFKPIHISSNQSCNSFFIINPAIRKCFKKASLAILEEEIIKWLLELDANRFRPFGRDRLRNVARHAISEGEIFNFNFKEEYIYFIYVMSYCGGWFHQSELFHEINDLFKDDIGDERIVRVKSLFPLLMTDYCGDIEKFKKEYIRFPHRISALMERIKSIENIRLHHVEKLVLEIAIGLGLKKRERLIGFMRLISNKCHDISLEHENLQAIYVLLSVILGKNFMHDPFFPWVSEIMKKEKNVESGLVAILKYAIKRSEKFARLQGDGYA